jgi:hypothetical protein
MAGKPKRLAKWKGVPMTGKSLPVRSFFTQGATCLPCIQTQVARCGLLGLKRFLCHLPRVVTRFRTGMVNPVHRSIFGESKFPEVVSGDICF